MVFDNTGSMTSFSSLLTSLGGSASQSSESAKPPMTIPLLRAAPPKPSTTVARASNSTTTSTVKQSLNGSSKPTNDTSKPARVSPPVVGMKRKADTDVNVQERKDRPKLEASSAAAASKAKPPKPTFGPAKIKTEPVSKPAPLKTTNVTSRPTTTQSTTPTTSAPGAKLSYKELMAERAKKNAAVSVIGLPPPVIAVKKTFTKEKKDWQKEILQKREVKMTKPGPSTTAKLEKDGTKPGAGKVEFGSAKMKAAAVGGKGKGLAGGKKGAEPPAPRQPPPKPLFGPDLLKKRKEETAGPSAAKRQKVPARGYGRERDYDREPVYEKRYVYAEDLSDEYDSADSSDMEASGFDILEEEYKSERVAIKEDLLEQKREEQRAKIKAARKTKK